MVPTQFQPKLFTILKEGYSKDQFLSDLVAGIIVGIVALPLAIAFAIASGVRPEQGLYTAIVAGIIVSVFGGSRVQISGPTGAFIVIVYGIVQNHGYGGLAIATLIAGVMLVLLGLARLGTLLRFVPYPLIVGFTSGIAVIIFTSQLNDLLGLQIQNLPVDFVHKWIAYAENIASSDMVTVLTGGCSFLIIVLWPRVTRKVPGSLVAILVVTAVVQFFHIPVETIGSRFGAVPDSFPIPTIPAVTWQTVMSMFSPAVTIALLGGIESLLSAVVADGMIRSRHRSNIELIAQGAANIIAPLFSGIPATGAIARTATNVKNGGRTPIAGIVHAIVLLITMLLFGQWAALIPLPTLAAILVVVSYHMSEWKSFVRLLRSPRSDVAVMLVTFFLTVVVDLTVALEVGILLAALLFMRRMAEVSQVNAITRDLREDQDDDETETRLSIPDGVEVFQVYGTLFFGAVEQFTESIRSVQRKPKVLILETSRLLAIDATGLRALEDIVAQFTTHGSRLLISGIHKQPLSALTQSGLLDQLGEEILHGSLSEALEHAKKIMNPSEHAKSEQLKGTHP
jgi:SulP family sulfate permease